MPSWYISGFERPRGPVFSGTGTSYSGPGDVVASAVAWWGARAYSAAKAAANAAAIRLIRSSDSTQQDILLKTDGTLDTSVSFFDGSNYKVVTWYDQTGNGHDLSQGTDAIRPAFVLNVLSSKPIVRVAAGATNSTMTTTAITQAQPLTLSIIASRTANFTTNTFVLGDTNCVIGYRAATNQLDCYAGTDTFAAASDSTFHAIQFVANGASGDINVDGSANTVNAGAGGLSATFTLNGIFSQFLDGDVAEAGLWGSAFTGTQSSNMSSNQHAYWGF